MMKVCLASVIAATMLLASDRECQSDRDKIVGCVEKEYYSNGRLMGEARYKNGKRNGVEKAYYSSSEPFADVIWNNGEITSAKCHNGSIPTSAQLHNFSKSDDLSDLCGETPH
ncbi:hypothetical protein [Helicobacter canis]|uniref:toxin-antitoxin system YwqK family antitoxin n=1 Tax=Helicobacter canis TaxID=29419 RepID=UPI002941C27E|nr:hypothetical protein [Helicobacter canis]